MEMKGVGISRFIGYMYMYVPHPNVFQGCMVKRIGHKSPSKQNACERMNIMEKTVTSPLQYRDPWNKVSVLFAKYDLRTVLCFVKR